MHPVDCPVWEYQNISKYQSILEERISGILINLRSGKLDINSTASDTRPVHKYFFEYLTPFNYAYYAGNYRGENYRCLRFYNVFIRGDPRVGFRAETVPIKMGELGDQIRNGFAALDLASTVPDAQLSNEDKVLYAVVFACRVFEIFLRIHPYVNGNGHVARFLIWAILGRYGYWPEQWPIEPRPSDPPYSQLIIEYRNGNREPLEHFVLQCIG